MWTGLSHRVRAAPAGSRRERPVHARGWRKVVGCGFVGLALVAVKLKLAGGSGTATASLRSCARGRSEPVWIGAARLAILK